MIIQEFCNAPRNILCKYIDYPNGDGGESSIGSIRMHIYVRNNGNELVDIYQFDPNTLLSSAYYHQTRNANMETIWEFETNGAPSPMDLVTELIETIQFNNFNVYDDPSNPNYIDEASELSIDIQNVPENYILVDPFINDDGDLEMKFKYIETTTYTTGIKGWIADTKPNSITIELYADNVKIDETVVNATNNWKHVFTDLPVYEEDGETVINYYSIPAFEEVAFMISEGDQAEDGGQLYNVIAREGSDPKITYSINYNMHTEALDKRPTEFTYTIYADGTTKGTGTGSITDDTGTITLDTAQFPEYNYAENATYEYTIEVGSIPEWNPVAYTVIRNEFAVQFNYTPAPVPPEPESHFIGAAKFVSADNDIAAMYAEGIKLL